MGFSIEHLEEIKLLSQFSLESTGTGLKVHTSQAPAETVAAASRLFNKGLTDQVDGGYLTPLGVEAAKHAQSLTFILQSK